MTDPPPDLERDISAIFEGRVCTPETEEACRMEYGQYFESTCRRCRDEEQEKIRACDISPWTHHMLELRRLQQGGYPFGGNDLELEEWQDLGRVNDLIRQIEKKREMQLMMPRQMGL